MDRKLRCLWFGLVWFSIFIILCLASEPGSRKSTLLFPCPLTGHAKKQGGWRETSLKAVLSHLGRVFKNLYKQSVILRVLLFFSSSSKFR